MSDAKHTWQSYFLTVAVTALLTGGGACYTQLDGRIAAAAMSKENHEARLIKLETVLELELKQLRERVDEIRDALRTDNEYSGPRQ